MAYVIIRGGELSGHHPGFRAALAGPLRITLEHLDGLGAAPPPMTRDQLVAKGITLLVQANDRARKLADEVVSKSFITTRATNREWADTFKAQVEAMVARLITPGHDGIYPFERAPQLVDVVAEYIESESKNQADMQQELLGIGAGLREFTTIVAREAAAMIEAGLTPIIAAVGKSGIPWWALPLGAAAVAAYVWRAFR